MANFAALSALVAVLLISVFAVWRWYGESFIGYYAPTQIFLSGENPYEYDQIVKTILEVTGRGGNSPFYYPLWITFPLIPLVALPFQWSRLAWLAASVMAWAIAMWLTERLNGSRIVSGTRWLIWLFAFVLLGWFTLKVEQVAFMLFLDVGICLWAIDERRVTTASIAIALLLTKPSITFMPVAVLVPYAWLKDKRIVWGTMMSLAILFAISTMALPNWWAPILAGRLPNGWNTGLSGYEIDSRRLNTTMTDFLDYTMGIQGVFALAIQVGVGLIALWSIYRWRKSALFAVILAIVFGFLLTPYAMQYDYVFLTPAFLWVLHRIPQIDSSKLVPVIGGLIALVSVLFLERAVSDGLWIPIIILFLLFLSAPPISEEHVLPSPLFLKNETD